MLNLNAPLRVAPLVFFDVETTGLQPLAGDRVCEVALLRREGGHQVEWASLVNPGRAQSASAYAVNQISAADLAAAPPFAQIADALLPLLDGALLIAHNATFDALFVDNELSLLGYPPLHQPILDTLAVARRLLRRTSYSLGALAEAYGIPRPTHRAPDDVRALRSVFDAMLPALEARGVTTVEALLRYARGLQPNEPDPEPPALISLALSERRRLRLRYAGTRSPAPTEREVDPLEVTVERGALCLRAFCYLRNDVRTFVITRIVSVELV